MELGNGQGKSIAFHSAWTAEIPGSQWDIYQQVIERARHQGLRFSLGGAFAVATYTGRWRNTKDLDFYVLPPDRDTMVDVITGIGLQDYHEKNPYQRHWIYRAYVDDVIVDVIWAMANGRDVVDMVWLNGGPELSIRGEQVRIVPPEEMIYGKLYVLQKERSDWLDIFNIIYAVGPELDWERLVARLGSDAALLGAALVVFAWLSPAKALELPKTLWKRLGLRRPEKNASPELMRQRAFMLDTRPWFLPLLDTDAKD